MFQVWTNSIGRENATEKRELCLPEQALAKLEPEVLGMKTSENLTEKRIVLFNCLSIDENVIDVDSDAFQIGQGLIYKLLADSLRVNQSEWKPSVLTKPQWSECCSEWSAVGMQFDIMERLHESQLGEEFRPSSLLKQI